jgi:hypothetical protein
MAISARAIVRIIIAAVLIGAIAWRVDFGEVAALIGSVSVAPMALAVALSLVQVGLTSLRWHVVLKALGVSLPIAANIRANIVSILANSLILNVVAGMVTRSVYLRDRGQPVRHAFTSTVVERGLVLALLLALAAVGLAYLDLNFAPDTASLARWGAVVVAIGAAALLMVRASRLWWRDRAGAVEAEIGRAVRDAWRVVLDIRAMSIAAALTFASQAAMIGLGIAVALALRVDIPIVSLAAILPVIAIIAAIPISIAGFGVREYGAAVLLGALGVPFAQAALVGFLIGVFSLIGTALAGALALATWRRERAG